MNEIIIFYHTFYEELLKKLHPAQYQTRHMGSHRFFL